MPIALKGHWKTITIETATENVPMVTITATPTQQQTPPFARIVLKGVSWQTFQALLADVGDNRHCRFAYNQGTLEIMAPRPAHEEPKVLIADFVTALIDELDMESRQLGSLTLEREDLNRAVEPDTCFYIQNEFLVRGKKEIDLKTDPPPDLVLEVDYTSSSVNKLEIYASLGVPELWRYRRQTLQVYQLVGDNYELCNQSLAFPQLAIAEIPGFIEQSRTIGHKSALRAFRARIREILQNP